MAEKLARRDIIHRGMEHAKAAPYLQANGRSYGTDKKLPTLDETEAAPEVIRHDEVSAPDGVTHWSKVDRWAELGREVGLLKLEAKRQAKSIHDLPGAPSKIAEFLELGRELQRSSR